MLHSLWAHMAVHQACWLGTQTLLLLSMVSQALQANAQDHTVAPLQDDLPPPSRPFSMFLSTCRVQASNAYARAAGPQSPPVTA